MLESEIGPARLGKMLTRQSPEGYPKVRTVERVNERIYSRIDPTEPS